jgi:hypothetical protein
MRFLKRLCQVFVLVTVLFGGQILHMWMRPVDIEELMTCTRRAKAEATIQDPETRDEMLRRLLRLFGFSL